MCSSDLQAHRDDEQRVRADGPPAALDVLELFHVDAAVFSSLDLGPTMPGAYAGNASACSTFSTIGTDAAGLPILQFFSGPQNFAREKARGFDIEASYTLPLDTVNSDWAGKLSWRGLATHAIEDTTTSGVVGSIPSNSAGQNTGAGPPKWRFQTSLNYSLDPISLTLTMRGQIGRSTRLNSSH